MIAVNVLDLEKLTRDHPISMILKSLVGPVAGDGFIADHNRLDELVVPLECDTLQGLCIGLQLQQAHTKRFGNYGVMRIYWINSHGTATRIPHKLPTTYTALQATAVSLERGGVNGLRHDKKLSGKRNELEVAE